MPRVKAPKQPNAPQQVYQFRAGFRSSLDPQTVGQYLEQLRAQKGGILTPEDVLEAARDPSSLLHDHFDWDDADAAEKHRRRQANELVAAVRVVRVLPTGPTHITPTKPAYIKTEEEDGTRGYITVATATAPPRREHTLAEIIHRYYILTTRERGLGYTELDPFFALIDNLRTLHPMQ
jgi:hypothetical protein